MGITLQLLIIEQGASLKQYVFDIMFVKLEETLLPNCI